MRPIEWSRGAMQQNILPPTLNTATPSHCTMRVAAGRLAQNRSICFGVTPHPTRRRRRVRWSGMTEWRAAKLARRLPYLQARAQIQMAMRAWFAEQGFIEVE